MFAHHRWAGFLLLDRNWNMGKWQARPIASTPILQQNFLLLSHSKLKDVEFNYESAICRAERQKIVLVGVLRHNESKFLPILRLTRHLQLSPEHNQAKLESKCHKSQFFNSFHLAARCGLRLSKLFQGGIPTQLNFVTYRSALASSPAQALLNNSLMEPSSTGLGFQYGFPTAISAALPTSSSLNPNSLRPLLT